MTLMFAYGSNLNLAEMAKRCPDAVPLGHIRLDGWKLVFRGVADVIREDGAVCYGGVWRITPECERTLDVYEGVGSGVYRKEYIPSKPTPLGETEILVYTMTSTGIMPPSKCYYEVIKEGYRNFCMPTEAFADLERALCESHDNKALTHVERRRRMRTGHPAFAERPDTRGTR